MVITLCRSWVQYSLKMGMVAVWRCNTVCKREKHGLRVLKECQKRFFPQKEVSLQAITERMLFVLLVRLSNKDPIREQEAVHQN